MYRQYCTVDKFHGYYHEILDTNNILMKRIEAVEKNKKAESVEKNKPHLPDHYTSVMQQSYQTEISQNGKPEIKYENTSKTKIKKNNPFSLDSDLDSLPSKEEIGYSRVSSKNNNFKDVSHNFGKTNRSSELVERNVKKKSTSLD